ncbi:MAG: alpha-2-macroglobulin family protein [Opitutaceae bacterium]
MPQGRNNRRLAGPWVWVLWLSLGPVLLAQAPAQSYQDHLAAAREFTALRSHARATEAYRAALAAAPDDEARRWCTLWELQSQYRTEGYTYSNRQSLRARVEGLLAPYLTAGRNKDRFWAEASLLSSQLGPATPSPMPSGLVQLTFATEEWAWLAQSDDDFESLEKLIHGLVAMLPRRKAQAPSDTTESQPALDLIQRVAERHPAGPGQVRIRNAYATALEFTLNQAERGTVARAYDWVAESATTPAAKAAAEVNALWWRHLAKDPDGMRPEVPWSAEEYARVLAQIEAALAHFDPANPQGAGDRVGPLSKFKEHLTSPHLRISATSTLSPDSTLGVDVEAQHLSRVGLRIVALDGRDFLTLQTTADRTKVDLTPYLGRPSAAAWEVNTHTAPKTLGRVALRTHWNRGLKPGYYVLLAHDPDSGGAKPGFVPFLVTGIQAIGFRTGSSSLEIHAFDVTTLAPVKPLNALLWVDQTPSPTVSSGEDGVVRTEAPKVKVGYTPIHATGTSGDGQPFHLIFYDSARGGDTPRDFYQFHLFSDRSLYQPGETARWRLVARKQSIDGLSAPAQSRVRVWANTADGAQLGVWELTLNARGTAGGELAIPDFIGATSVTFNIAAEDEGQWFRDQVDAFRIDHFRAPEATLSLEPDLAILRAPDSASRLPVTLLARYLSGEPVVKATLSVHAVLFQNRPGTEWPDADVDRHDRQRVVKHHSFNLDTGQHGQAALHLPLPTPLPDHLHVRLDASLDAPGTTARSTHTFEIPRSGITVQLTYEHTSPLSEIRFGPEDRVEWIQRIPTAIPPGKVTSLTVSTRDGLSLPVAASGLVTLKKWVWDEIWRAPDGTLLAGEALDRRRDAAGVWPPRSMATLELWEQIRGEERAATIAAFDVTTDEAGVARIDLPALTPGRYSVTFEAPDNPRSDLKPLAALEFIVAAPRERLPIQPRLSPLILPLTTDLRPGEPIRALVALPQSQRRVWLRLATPWTSETRIETFTDAVQLVTFPWSSASASGAQIEASLLGDDGQFLGTSTRLRLAAEEQHLDLKLEATPRVAAPGSAGRLRITSSTGPKLTRLPAEFAVSVRDAAVDALAPTQSRSLIQDLNPDLEIAGTRRFTSSAPRFLSPLQPELPEFSAVLLTRELSALLRGVTVHAIHDGYAQTLHSASRTNEPPAANVSKAHDPRVRSRFTYTAAWFAAVESDANGEATVDFTYPDNLTTWRITAEAIGDKNRFGTASAETQTTLPLQSRLRLPRTVVAGDTLGALAAVVSADTEAREATAALRVDEADAGRLERISPEKTTLQVSARSEAVAGWSLRATQAGDAALALTARTAVASDGMQLTLPILEDGFLQPSGASGRVGDLPLTLTLDLPSPLDPDRTTVEVQLAPGVAASVVGALPYLIDYPYGCVEQTMSRFLPAVVARSWLREIGSDDTAIDQAILAASRRPATRSSEPPPTLDAVVKRSLSQLSAAAAASGDGFGWWPGGESDDFMTAYVLRGLSAARRAGISLPPGLEQDTLDAVLSSLPEKRWNGEDPLNAVWLLSSALGSGLLKDKGLQSARITYEQIHLRADQLPPVGIALLLQSAHSLTRSADIPALVHALEAAVRRHSSGSLGETAVWGQPSGYAPHLTGVIESTAFCLDALLLVDPRHPLIDPAAAALLLNRQSNHWSNTRDTAHAALALLAYARNRGDAAGDATFRVSINDRALDTVTLKRDSLLTPHLLRVPASVLQPGRNTLQVTRLQGQSIGNVTITAQSWARATAVKPLGDFLKASRDYARLTQRTTFMGRSTPTPEPLPASGTPVNQGKMLECRVRLEVPRELDYVMVSCPKPGGSEPINPLSGWDAVLVEIAPPEGAPPSRGSHGLGRSVYREEHPDRSVFFLHRLPAGTWELRYTLRATFAGDYRALPVVAQAMYAPIISANTDARRLVIQPVSSEPP